MHLKRRVPRAAPLVPRLLLGLLLAALAASPALAQQPDGTRADSAVELEEIEVVGSIVPTAGPGVGSGVPARIATVTGREIDAWEPRLLTDEP